MLWSSVRFRAMKKKITFWRCQWELGSPYCLSDWCLTLLTDSDWQPAPRLTHWLTRTARRHRDWLALIDSDFPPTPRLTQTSRRHPDWPAVTWIACPLPYTQDINRSFASCEQNPDAIFMLLLHNTLTILVEGRGALASGLLTLCKERLQVSLGISCAIFFNL